MPGMHMITRSRVDENTVFLSGLTDITRAKASFVLSGDLTISSQSDVYTVEEEQTVITEEILLKQHVDKLLIVFNELDDTAKLNIDVNDVTTSNQSIIDEVFIEQSSSISYEDVVTQDRASYPETIDGCIQAINELRHAVKALHFTINENEHLFGCLQADALSTQQGTDQLHRERGH